MMTMTVPDPEQTRADVTAWVSRLDQAIADLRAEIARQQGEHDDD